jgi:hypothetical protein
MLGCPDYPMDCKSVDAPQRNLSAEEQERIIGRAAPHAKNAQICSYCRLGYVPSPSQQRLGWLNGGVLGAGFKPIRGMQ